MKIQTAFLILALMALLACSGAIVGEQGGLTHILDHEQFCLQSQDNDSQGTHSVIVISVAGQQVVDLPWYHMMWDHWPDLPSTFDARDVLLHLPEVRDYYVPDDVEVQELVEWRSQREILPSGVVFPDEFYRRPSMSREVVIEEWDGEYRLPTLTEASSLPEGITPSDCHLTVIIQPADYDTSREERDLSEFLIGSVDTRPERRLTTTRLAELPACLAIPLVSVSPRERCDN